MQHPLISIIVPCYNQAEFLGECLQSVLDQTYPNWECIIVNDGSADNTEEIGKNWVKKDVRFKYYKKENGGVSSARNYGIEKSAGLWILPLDGDDRIGNQYLELAEKEFEKEPQIIYCEAEYFGVKTGKMILDPFNKHELFFENQIFCTAFFKKEAWNELSGYDENMDHGYEDWEFWIRLCNLYENAAVIKLDFTGFYYRIKHQSRNTGAVSINDNKIRDYIIEKNKAAFTNSYHYIKTYIYKSKKVMQENASMKEKLDSKRYKIIDNILSIFNK